MIGFIFYDYKNGLNLYLYRNSNDYYEDIIINNDIINDISNTISPIFKSVNNEMKHTTLILNIKKYNDLIDNDSKLVKISLKKFNDKFIHKNMKHKRIRTVDLMSTLNLINLNYNIYYLKDL